MKSLANYTYKIFDVLLSSNFMIPGARESFGEDVILEHGVIPENLEDITQTGALFQINHTQFLFKSLLNEHFFISSRNKIITNLTNCTPMGQTYLLGPVLGAYLQLNNKFPLHGSAVSFQQKACVICGISGAGKSTLTAALLTRGSKLISDDVALINVSNMEVALGPKYLKLWLNSMEAIELRASKKEPLGPNIKKYFIYPEALESAKQKCTNIFILKAKPIKNPVIKKLHGLEKFNALKENTYRKQFTTPMNKALSHFQFISSLAKHVVVHEIHRPMQGFWYDYISDYIEQILMHDK